MIDLQHQLLINDRMLEEADDLLLDTVATFVQVHGGIAEMVGGVEIVRISPYRFSVCIHVEGFAPPRPGAPVDG